jgi:hypothetical protein
MKRLINSASVLVVLVFCTASGANAITSDKRTLFTFNAPVALPGVTLPAGTYMFRLADPDTTRRVIQVANEKGNQSYALLLTTPSERMEVSGEAEIRFRETASGAPAAVQAWWYPGESVGYEFMYSKSQLEDLNRDRQPEPAAAIGAGEASIARSEPSDDEEAISKSPVEDSSDVIDGPGLPPEPEAQSTQAQVPPSEPAPAPETREAVSQDAREELPQTASPIALLLLAGLATASTGWLLSRKS